MDFLLWYNNAQESLWFPVIPNEGIVLKYTHNNTVFEGVEGAIQAIGTPGLRTFELESIFPMKKYPFIRPKAALFAENGWYYVGMIERGLAAKVPFRAWYFDNDMKVIFNMPVTIYSFEYWITQSRDIGYRLAFTEYRWANPEESELAKQTASDTGTATEAGSNTKISGTINGMSTVQTSSQAAISSLQGYTKYYDDTDALYLAKTMWGEARGVHSLTEVACIGWCAANRVDSTSRDFPQKTIKGVLTAPNQFYYKASHKTVNDYGDNLLDLANDVLTRWSQEKSGQASVGRVLPKNYCWYAGDGSHNYYYPSYPCMRAQRWNYSLPSPYG